MDSIKKVTIHLPGELLKRALKNTGASITETVRKGLEILAAQDAYDGVRKYRGKVKFRKSWEELKDDRR